MRTNLEHSHIHNPRVSGIRHFSVGTTLTGTQVIPNDGPTVWVLNGGSGDRTVRLPDLMYEREIVISNVGSTNNLNITDSNANALVSIAPQAMGIFYASVARWTWLIGSFASSSVVAKTVVVATTSVNVTDSIVQVNGVGAVVLTLPSSTAWDASAGTRGLPLSITDISGGASSNNITINPAGGQTISGLASYIINTDYGSVSLMPKSGGGWVLV